MSEKFGLVASLITVWIMAWKFGSPSRIDTRLLDTMITAFLVTTIVIAIIVICGILIVVWIKVRQRS